MRKPYPRGCARLIPRDARRLIPGDAQGLSRGCHAFARSQARRHPPPRSTSGPSAARTFGRARDEIVSRNGPSPIFLPGGERSGENGPKPCKDRRSAPSRGIQGACLFLQILSLLAPFGRFLSRRLDFHLRLAPCRDRRHRHRRRLFPDIVTTRRLSACKRKTTCPHPLGGRGQRNLTEGKGLLPWPPRAP